MPDERDRRRIISPPAGVREQTAPPESWENDDSHADDSETTLGRISRRVKLTASTSQITLDNVGALRRDLDVRVANLEGKLDMLLGALEQERAERRQYTAVSVSAFQFGLDIDKSRALAAIEMERIAAAAGIESRKAASDYKRQLAFKFLGGIAAIWAVVSTIVLARSH